MTFHTGPKFEAVVPIETLDHVALAKACVKVAERAGIPQSKLQFYGRRVSSTQLETQVRLKQSFLLDADAFEAHLSSLPAYRIAHLTVVGIEEDLRQRCAESVCAASALVTARWIDAEYENWQNAEDPAIFKDTGRSTEDLPMRHNRLPPPLDQMIVDTTRNPGRSILRDGYLEAIAHRMWLGQAFFERVPGVGRGDVLTTPWLKTTERPDGVLEILAHDQPFRDKRTDDIQRRLRRLLFPTTFELRSTPQGHDVEEVN